MPSPTVDSNLIKKEQKFIDFQEAYRLSRPTTFKNFIDYRLSTRVRGGSERKKTRSPGGSGLLFLML